MVKEVIEPYLRELDSILQKTMWRSKSICLGMTSSHSLLAAYRYHKHSCICCTLQVRFWVWLIYMSTSFGG